MKVTYCGSKDKQDAYGRMTLTALMIFFVIACIVLLGLFTQIKTADAAVPENQHGVWDDPAQGGSQSYDYNSPQQYANHDEWDPDGDVDPPLEGESSNVATDCARCHNMTGGEVYSLPHGRYTTSTNKCRDCHAVHRASGEFVLTRADDAYTACDFCHGTGSGSGRKVQMADEGVSNGHHLGYSGYAPDTDETTPYLIDGFTCHDCHSVHANRKRMVRYINHDPEDVPDDITLPHKGALLLGRPNPANTADHAFCAQPVDLTDWCSACHEGNGAINNGGGAKDHKTPMSVYDNITDSFEVAYSHDSQTNNMSLNGTKYQTCDTEVVDPAYVYVNPQDTNNQGPSCRQCHASSWLSEFPHKSDGYVLLKPGASDTALDNVCLDCHPQDALP